MEGKIVDRSQFAYVKMLTVLLKTDTGDISKSDGKSSRHDDKIICLSE